MKKIVLYLIFFLSALSVWGAKNPFAQFVGKPYASYHYALRDSMRVRYKSRNLKFVQLSARQMKSLPDVFHDGQWQIEGDYLLTNFDHDWQNGSDALFQKRLLKLLAESRNYGNKIWEMRILRRLFDFYKTYNLTEAVAYGRKLEKVLPQVTIEECPDIIDNEYHLAEMYMAYHSYEHAEKYYKMVIASPVFAPNQRISILAINDLGILYRDYYHDLKRSDSCFNAIFAFDRKHSINQIRMHRFAMAYSELGRNQYLRHHYAAAIGLLKKAAGILSRETCEDNDNDYTTYYEVSCCLAECYCETRQYPKARQSLTTADSCYRLIPPETESRQDYFTAKSKFLSDTGDAQGASDFIDSALQASRAWYLQHNADLFFEIEQQAGRAELQQKSLESKRNHEKFMSVLLISFVFIILLAIYAFLYYQKRKAYRALVIRNQQWAESSPMITPPEEKTDKEKPDNKLYDDIEQYLTTTKSYCNPDLTLDMLAKELGKNRTYISNAINKTNENFNSLINRFRIRLAVQLLSQDKQQTIEEVAYAVGFNNRKSFYNAFLTITGLSPSQFRNNLQ
jgi:AraC-like DNA-binding protein